MVGDLNGDGIDDIIGLAGASWWAALSNGTSFTNKLFGTWTGTNADVDVTLADVNGDGKKDLVWRSGNVFRAGISNGDQFIFSTLTSWSNAVTWESALFADANGDGKMDILARQNGNWWIGRSKATGGYDVAIAAQWSPSVTWRNSMAIDLSGDARADLVGLEQGTVTGTKGGNFWQAISTSFPFTTSYFGAIPAAADYLAILPGDINGDGKTDILAVQAGTGDCFVVAGGSVTNFGKLPSITDQRDFALIDFDKDEN